MGAAGVVWALDRLRARGYAETTLDLVAVMWGASGMAGQAGRVLIGLPKPKPTRPALFMGESGILLVLWRLDPSEEIADDLHALVLDNLSNPANDVMWGTPGTLLAARLMHVRARARARAPTGEERWAEAARQSEAAVLDSRREDGLWENVLHGESYRGLGPFHGAAGNVLVLRLKDLGDVLRETAVVEGGLVNWPTAVSDDDLLMQWCAGAPGS